jgi:hypothetical protein
MHQLLPHQSIYAFNNPTAGCTDCAEARVSPEIGSDMFSPCQICRSSKQGGDRCRLQAVLFSRQYRAGFDMSQGNQYVLGQRRLSVGTDLVPWISQYHLFILVSVHLTSWMERVGSAVEVDESEMNMLMLIYGVTESSVGFGG